MKTPPLFLFNLPDGKDLGRSIVFPVAVQGNKVILAGAAHSVSGKTGNFETFLADTNGNVLPKQETPAQVLTVPSEQGSDLVLVGIQMNEMPVPVRLTDRSVTRGMTLYHSRNVMFKDDFKEQASVITEQIANPLSRRFAFIGNKYFDADERRRLGLPMLKSPLRGLAMRSWHGVSGSPLWDAHGTVLGMVNAGTDALTPSEPEYLLVYLPAKEIKRSLERYAKYFK